MLLHGNNIIILGDLNCNILDDTVDSRTFKELCASFNLTQLVKEPTRITETKRSLIDVIMTIDPTLAESSSVIKSSISDHNLVEITLKISRPKVIKPNTLLQKVIPGTHPTVFAKIFLLFRGKWYTSLITLIPKWKHSILSSWTY